MIRGLALVSALCSCMGVTALRHPHHEPGATALLVDVAISGAGVALQLNAQHRNSPNEDRVGLALMVTPLLFDFGVGFYQWATE